MLYWKKGVRMNGGDNLTPEIKEFKNEFKNFRLRSIKEKINIK